MLSHKITGGIPMKKIKKNKGKMDKNLTEEKIRWYRERIIDLVHKIEDERFLNQILTILRKHIEKRGD